MKVLSVSSRVLIAVTVLTAGMRVGAQAQEGARHRDRPLTITRHHGAARGTGIEVRNNGNEVVAWGGFGANGYGYGRMGSEAARRAVRNEAVRGRTAGVYGNGVDGLGGTFDDGDNSAGLGFSNPYYGNSYNGYTGYNGVPTAFAFGPSFANRHITDNDDDDATDVPGPTPPELGYAPTVFGSDD